jgi:hypothetical protein
MRKTRLALIAAALPTLALAAQPAAQPATHPRDREIHDADTRAWWHLTEALSGDDLEGRDTGSPAYERSATWVAGRFKAAGLQPAGQDGYLQHVPMHQVDVLPEGTSFTLLRKDGTTAELAFLQQVSVAPTDGLPAMIEAPVSFRGYCGKEAMQGIAGQLVACFGNRRAGLPLAAERAANARAGKAVGLINIDDPGFTIEPAQWPLAYARSVSLRLAPAGESPAPLAVVRLGADAAAMLFAGSGIDVPQLLARGSAKQPLASADLAVRLRMRLAIASHDISASNILARLPGSDPKLAGEYVIASAHLDGYGYGTPVAGDQLYNGTLDDAAYVALLIQMADDIHHHRLPAPKRSVLFIAWTGEEKGLLGSRWFVAHPTVPLAQVAGVVNLDQLRPLFPLLSLTTEGLEHSTLGELARTVGAPLHIEMRPDSEPERLLLTRSDWYPFLQAHVPALGFSFGFDSGTDSEARYREWYRGRYHKPQDDLGQPVDFEAARHFNEFFYRLVGAIADVPERPAILPGSPFATGK